MRFHGLLFDHLDQRSVVAGGKKRLVKKQVLAEHAPQVTLFHRRAVPVVNQRQLAHQGGRGGQGDEARSAGLDQCTHYVKLLHFGRAVVTHRGAPVRLPHDDAHCFQLSQRLASHMALDVEPLSEFFLDQSLAGAHLAKCDFLFERTHHVGQAGL